MEGPHQNYLDNLAAARSLAKPRFSAGLSDEEVIEAIRDRAEQLFRLHQENDSILKEILFSKTGETLTPEEAAALEELAAALFNYNRSPDVGVAYYIHKLLYDYASVQNDVDEMVKELYYLGITLFYLNVRNSDMGIDVFVEQIGAYFSAGAAYLDRYDEMENPQTRSYIIRCLGNMKYGIKSIRGGGSGGPHSIMEGWRDYARVFERAMDIVRSPRYREKDPEIPWDDFVYTLHYDRTQFLGGLRARYDPEVADAVLESAEYVYQHQEQIAAIKDRAVGARTRYVYAAARYHSGLIPIQALMAELTDIFESADDNDFSGDGIWTILTMPEYLKYYTKLLPDDEREAMKADLDRAVERQKEYLFRLPQNEYSVQVSRALQTMSEQAAGDEAFQRRVLDYILACHPPTYIHSEVVAELARRFCARMAEVSPRLLDGAFGMERPADHPEELEVLLDKAYHSGLYHDMGKCMLINYVGQYSRRLLDEEFACIKLHPIFGCNLLESLEMTDHANVARYHHRSYDLTGGYPMAEGACPSSVQALVDIITVVDALDAGTDNIGRSYAAAKNYAKLVEELRLGRGTRYAPGVVDLLEDQDFCRETEQFLAEVRRKAYLAIYREKK